MSEDVHNHICESEIAPQGAAAALPLSRKEIVHVLLVLISCFSLLLIQRLHTYDEPLERDILTYALIGRELLQGRDLYSDLWDIKPPAVYVVFAGAQALAGTGALAIFLLNISAATAMLLAIYVAARRLTDSMTAALWAAVIWTAISSSLVLQANQPNTELFINLCVTIAFAALLDKRLRSSASFVAGAMFLLASLFKTVAVAYALPAAAGVLLAPSSGVSRRKAIAQILSMAGIGAAGWAFVFLYFGLTDRFTIFYQTVFTYGQAYAGSLSHNLLTGFRPGQIFPPYALFLLLPMVPAILGMVWGIARNEQGTRRKWILFLCFAAGAWLTRNLPGQQHPHYYQLWLPWVAVGSAAGLHLLIKNVPVRNGVLAVLSGMLLLAVNRHLAWPAERWSRAKYGDMFWQSRELAGEVKNLLRGAETLYEFGNEPAFYYATDLPLPSGVIWSHHVLIGPLREQLTTRLMRDLQSAPPDLIVQDMETLEYVHMRGGHPVQSLIDRDYAPLPYGEMRGTFRIHVRRGSDLQTRLLNEGPPYAVAGNRLMKLWPLPLNQKTQSIPATQDLQGHVDGLQAKDGQLQITGWAKDLAHEEPAREILVFADEQLVAVGTCNVLRKDIPGYAGVISGFGFQIQLPQRIDRDGIMVYAVSWRDQAKRIK